MDLSSLQLRETWLRVDIIIARSFSERPVELEQLKTVRELLPDHAMPVFHGLIGWYALQCRTEIQPGYHKPFGFKKTTYSMVFRFVTETVRGLAVNNTLSPFYR